MCEVLREILACGLPGISERDVVAGAEADDGTRTHDTWLGKPVLYQLSYVRAPPILAPR